MVAQMVPSRTLLSGEVLGTLVMFELRDAIAVPEHIIKAEWKRLGLDEKYLPSPRQPKNAFRKATPRKVLQNNLMLNEYKGKALPKGTQMACVLVRALPTKTKAKFAHSNRAVIYLNADGKLDIEHYGSLDQHELEYLSQVQDAFGRAQVMIDGSQMREAISRVLRAGHAVPFREGAYLVPVTQSLTSQALMSIIPWLNAYTGGASNRITSIEYLDTPEQRTQLKDVLSDFIDREVQAKIADAHSYVAYRGNLAKPIGDRKRSTTLGDLLALDEQIADYESVLQIGLFELRRATKYTKELTEQILAGS